MKLIGVLLLITLAASAPARAAMKPVRAFILAGHETSPPTQERTESLKKRTKDREAGWLVACR